MKSFRDRHSSREYPTLKLRIATEGVRNEFLHFPATVDWRCLRHYMVLHRGAVGPVGGNMPRSRSCAEEREHREDAAMLVG